MRGERKTDISRRDVERERESETNNMPLLGFNLYQLDLICIMDQLFFTPSSDSFETN